MKWAKRIGIVVGILLVVLIAVPFFITLDNYIPQIEKAASDKLKEPVTIKNIRFSALPSPRVTVSEITIGKDDIKLNKVTAIPDLFSLFSATRVMRSIDIDGLILNQAAIDKIPVWMKPDPQKPQTTPVRIENIRLDNALIKLDKTEVGPLDMRLSLDDKGDPKEASITTRDDKLKLLITPDQGNYLIQADAKSWKVPVGPPIEFDQLTLKGVATLNNATFNEVSAKLYGGTVSGKATANWQKGIAFNGNLDINNVELTKIVPLVASNLKVAGRLTAKPVFSASAARGDQLMDALKLETPFNVEKGVLYGFDIQKAATSLVKQDSGGGQTQFEQLSGRLNMNGTAFRFTDLKIASGVMAANGNVNISPKKELSGQINAKVQALGASAGVPLTVAGTTSSPLLYPSGAAVAGAAVGTVLLGPGVGTAAGEKLGSMVQGLFGKKDEKAKK